MRRMHGVDEDHGVKDVGGANRTKQRIRRIILRITTADFARTVGVREPRGRAAQVNRTERFNGRSRQRRLVVRRAGVLTVTSVSKRCD
jgi:hypothetical protein